MVAWRGDDIVPGSTECQRKSCSKPAEVVLDGLPLCIDDADSLLERVQAVELAPELRELLPDWGE